jgi:Flp pilus assembly protein TadB
MLHGTQEQLRDDEVSSSLSRQRTAREEGSSRATLVRWLILLAIALAWMVIVGVVLWGMSHMILAVLLLCFGALIAYTIFPLVKLVNQSSANTRLNTHVIVRAFLAGDKQSVF